MWSEKGVNERLIKLRLVGCTECLQENGSWEDDSLFKHPGGRMMDSEQRYVDDNFDSRVYPV